MTAGAKTESGYARLRTGDSVEGWTRGTVGLTWLEDGRGLFLTAAHVVAGPDVDATGDAVWAPDGTVVGRVESMIPVRSRGGHVNRLDLAVVEALVPVEPFSRRSGSVAVGEARRRRGRGGSVGPAVAVEFGRIRRGSHAEFVYEAQEERVTCSGPEPVEEPVEVRHGRRIARFGGRQCVTLRVLSGRPRPGHSGALLMREAGGGGRVGRDFLLACGLVFAGDRQRVLVNRLGAVAARVTEAGATPV